MEVLLSLSTLIIKTSARMIQPSIISCGGTHHNLGQKVAKYHDRLVYTLETK